MRVVRTCTVRGGVVSNYRYRRPREVVTVRSLWNWWCGEWDYVFIVGALLVVALLVGGMIAASLDAIRVATVYH
jgi:hypothetical protein